MHVADTNVVVRYVTNDDPRQSPIARRFIDGNDVRIPWTVLVETEWVLRSAHKLPRGRIFHIFAQLAGLPTIVIDDASGFHTALGWFGKGMDFADALHLSCCNEGEALATFDRRLISAARKIDAGKVKAL